MDPLKEAFDKIKQDIEELRDAIFTLSNEVNTIKKEEPSFYPLSNMIYIPTDNFTTNYFSLNQTYNPFQSNINLSSSDTQTDTQTQNSALEALKIEKVDISKGNEGVQTDRQTDNQTLRQSFIPQKQESLEKNILLANQGYSSTSTLSNASEIITSLDHLKSDVSATFKSLTQQEITVFSALYSLEDEQIQEITYKLLANKLNLTESSIRDYINKLIQKGIPICKIKQNNKKILLSIEPSLKKIASLPSILALRDNNFIDDKNKYTLSKY